MRHTEEILQKCALSLENKQPGLGIDDERISQGINATSLHEPKRATLTEAQKQIKPSSYKQIEESQPAREKPNVQNTLQRAEV